MIISFLYPYRLRNTKAPHLWFFFKQLETLNIKETVFLGTEDYFKDYSKSTRDEVLSGAYKIPNKKDLSKLNKILIPYNIFDELEKNQNISNLQKWNLLMIKRYKPLEEFLNNVLYKLSKNKKIDCILTSCNTPSLSYIAKKYKIKIIHTELGALRAPYFIQTAYFDYCGVNGNTEFDKRYNKFKSEIKNDKFKFIGKDNLIKLIGTNLLIDAIKEKKEEKYNLGIAFQVDDDSNIVSYSNGYSNIDMFYLADSNFDRNKVLLRKHPSSKFNLDIDGFRLDNNDLNIEFIKNSKIIMGINSSLLFESLFYDKQIVVLGETSFKSFSSSLNRKRKIDYEKLEFYTIAYLIPYEFMYDYNYINFRLSNPTEVEIYNKNLNMYKSLNKPEYSFDLLEKTSLNNKSNKFFQLFYDYGEGTNENQSVKKYYNSNKSFKYKIDIPKKVKSIRIDPSNKRTNIEIKEFKGIQNGKEIYIKEFEGNFSLRDNMLLFFNTEDPIITFENKNYDSIIFSFEEVGNMHLFEKITELEYQLFDANSIITEIKKILN